MGGRRFADRITVRVGDGRESSARQRLSASCYYFKKVEGEKEWELGSGAGSLLSLSLFQASVFLSLWVPRSPSCIIVDLVMVSIKFTP